MALQGWGGEGAIPVCVQWGQSTDGMWLRDHEKTGSEAGVRVSRGLGLRGAGRGICVDIPWGAMMQGRGQAGPRRGCPQDTGGTCRLESG